MVNMLFQRMYKEVNYGQSWMYVHQKGLVPVRATVTACIITVSESLLSRTVMMQAAHSAMPLGAVLPF